MNDEVKPKPDAGGSEARLTHCSTCGVAYSPANRCWDDDGCWEERGIECHRNGKCEACVKKATNLPSPGQICAARNCREQEVAACAEWLISHGYVFAGERLRRDRPTSAPCPLEGQIRHLWDRTHYMADALITRTAALKKAEAEANQLRAQLAEARALNARWNKAVYDTALPNGGNADQPELIAGKTAEFLRMLRRDLAAERSRAEKAEKRLAEARLRLRPFASFGKYITEHPRRGMHDELYGWDNSEDAKIRQGDLLAAAALLARLEGK